MISKEAINRDEPVFMISVAARILGLRTQTLRYYERLGLVEPTRTRGNQRVYSQRDVEKVQHIRELIGDLGVNLAGVEVILRLLSRLQHSESENLQLRAENTYLSKMMNTTP